MALHFITIIRNSTDEDIPNTDLYSLLENVLTKLNTTHTKETLIQIQRIFYKSYLTIEGLLESPDTLITMNQFKEIYTNYTQKPYTPPLIIN